MKTRNAEVLGEKCVGCTSWYTGMGCTNERCPNGYKGAGSEDVPCDQPCDVVNDLAKEVDELKETVSDLTKAICGEIEISISLMAERDKLMEEKEKLRKDVEYLDALRDLADTMACEISTALQIPSDGLLYELNYAIGCLGVTAKNYWDAQSLVDPEPSTALDMATDAALSEMDGKGEEECERAADRAERDQELASKDARIKELESQIETLKATIDATKDVKP